MRIKIGNKLMKVNKNHPLVLIMEPGDEELMRAWEQAPPGHRYFIFLTGDLDDDVLGQGIQDEIDDDEGEEVPPDGMRICTPEHCYCTPCVYPPVELVSDCTAPPTKEFPQKVEDHTPEMFPLGSIYEGLCKMSRMGREDLEKTISETEAE